MRERVEHGGGVQVMCGWGEGVGRTFFQKGQKDC